MRFRLLSIISLFIFSTFTINAQDKNVRDSLELRLNHSGNEEKLNILLELSKINWSIEPQKGIMYADSALKLANELANYHLQGKALVYGGVNYWSIGAYDKAIEYYHDALTIADENDDKEIKAFAFNNIGMVYFQLDEYETAKENYLKASNILKELNNEIEYAKIIDNIAKIHLKQNNYNAALKSYQSIIEIIKKDKNDRFLLWVLCDIGSIYFATGQYDLAEKNYLQALSISNRIGDNIGRSMVLNYLGKLSLGRKKYQNAIKYLNEALKLAKQTEASEQIAKAYNNLSIYYSDIGDYKNSLEYFRLFKEISDDLYSIEREQKIQDIQVNYEILKREKENVLLSKDNKIQQLEIKRQSAINFYLVVFIIIVSVFVLIVLKQLKEKRKANKILSEKNDLILKQKQEIQSQADKLAESNATKDRLFSIIAHDLKSPFNSLLGYTKLLDSEYNNFSESERKDIITDINNSASNTFKLLDNMLTWAMAQRNAITLQVEKHYLYKIIDKCTEPYKLLAYQKEIKLNIDIPDDLALNFDKQTMSTVFINLINNAIKFTASTGAINIYSVPNDNYTDICFEDTGLGMDAETLKNLFLVSNSKIRKGTNNEKGTGLGLLICKDFVHANGGEIQVESKVGKGSVFKITLSN